MNYSQSIISPAITKSEVLPKQQSEKTRHLIPGQKYTFHMYGNVLEGKKASESYAKIRTFNGVIMLNGKEHVEVERINCKAYLLAIDRIKAISPAQ